MPPPTQEAVERQIRSEFDAFGRAIQLPTNSVSSVEGYLRFVTTLSSFQSEQHTGQVHIFRGEGRIYRTKLTPNIVRPDNCQPVQLDPHRPGMNITRQEVEEIKAFQRRPEGRNHRSFDAFRAGRWLRCDSSDWVGLVQHYGGQTRLLDVSRHGLIGLFFACFRMPRNNELTGEPWHAGNDGVVYCLWANAHRPQSLPVEEVTIRDIEQGIPGRYLDLFEPPRVRGSQSVGRTTGRVHENVPHLYRPLRAGDAINRRLDAQSGYLVWWHPVGEWYPHQTVPVMIDGSAKPLILRQLYEVGVSPSTVFPDEEGDRWTAWLRNHLP